jgi:hypothetical protein
MRESTSSGSPSAQSSPEAAPGASTPIWAALLFTSINSAAGVVTSGIYYLTDQTYKFSREENYALGAVLGVTYIAGALGAGPVLRGLRGVAPGLSTRAVLLTLMVLMAVLCLVPWVGMRFLAGDVEPGARPAAWPVWTLILLYSPLTGVLWPIVESYVSGGKRGHALRSTIGIWNVTWSGSLVLSTVAIAPFVEGAASEAIAAVAIAHLGGAAILLAFTREPAKHLHDDAHAVPAVYPRLLVTFRMLLPMSYLVSTALTPYLPGQFKRLGIAAMYFTVVGAIWLLARVACFALLQQWSGWHGRWWPAIAAPIMLLAGFALCVFAHTLGTGAGLAVVSLGLAFFGIGMAAIYCGAIYYAMEVGSAQVDAGGAHEALIGVGYTAGPLCGLAAGFAVTQGLVSPDGLEPLLLASVGGIAVIVAAATARRVAVQARG